MVMLKVLIFAGVFVLCSSKSMFLWKGTRWCGYGSAPQIETDDIPKHNKTLNEHVDNCCKQHDQCPYFIPRWKRKYNLLNWRPFTISSCECDRKFLKCLQNDTSEGTTDVKRIYFDILEVACFNIKLKSVEKCVERTWFMACKKFSMTTEFQAEIEA